MSAPRADARADTSRPGAVGLALLARHAPDSLVAFGAQGERSARDLLTDAARVARALPDPSDDSHVLLVFERDRYALAAALLGSLARGHAIALPPNARRDSILAVEQRPTSVAVAHDTAAGLELDVPALLARAEASGETTRPIASPLDLRGRLMGTVFTSGSTGPMTAWRKSSDELLGEALGLARQFVIGPGDRIVATVPAGHIYGLLFSVLLPLVSGAAFSRDTPHHAAAVAECVRRDRATVLASVPVHLRALAATPTDALASLRRVFSSTGPLPESVALDFADRHARPITEILGSTETGGIAHRSRRRPPVTGAGGAPPGDDRWRAFDDSWRPFDDVRVSVGPAGHLCVDSPYLHADLPRPFQTADLVTLRDDGRFEHHGRADGIVKIGGHRVATHEVEERLRDCEGVEDAAVVAIPAEGARGHQLLAVVAPADVEPAALRERLLERFEPTCLPRRIRCLDRLPREANGKLPREKLLRLFGLDASGSPGSMSLDWQAPVRESEGERVRFERAVRIPDDYGWFLGHFDGYPVLAGAVQLKELVLPTIAAAFPDLGAPRSLGRVKFNGRIVPGDELVVRLSRRGSAPRVGFEIERLHPADAGSPTLCTSGTITLDVASDAAPEAR